MKNLTAYRTPRLMLAMRKARKILKEVPVWGYGGGKLTGLGWIRRAFKRNPRMMAGDFSDACPGG